MGIPSHIPSATEEFSNNPWNSKVHHCIQYSHTLVLKVSQIKISHTTPSYFSNIPYRLLLVLYVGLFPSCFSTKPLHSNLVYAMRTIFPANFFLFFFFHHSNYKTAMWKFLQLPVI
jgi:hypothetical protein